MRWTTACPDWAERLRSRLSIIPPPLFPEEAERALAIFKSLRVVDVPGRPTFGECCDEWVFDFVAVIFGGYDGSTGRQMVREFFLLISKKNTKSTIVAGIMLTSVILHWRDEEEHLLLSPTKEVADNSFKPAAAMVRADPELAQLFHIQDHTRTITHRVSNCSLKVVAADTDAVSGKKSGRVAIDEFWLFGSRANAESMLMEVTGGQVSRPEGWIIYLSTQSDTAPAGAFLEKLRYARAVRDGVIVDPKFLPVIYEFSREMLDSKSYLDPQYFHVTNPNLGRSVSAEWIEDQLKRVLGKTDGTLQQFLAKHLNVEIGLALASDSWTAGVFWEKAAEKLTLDDLLKRCEVCTIGLDGGGLDDLFGLAVVGRDKSSRKWLWWSHAWAHEIAMERRKEIAPRLLDFQRDGDLTIVAVPGDDVVQVADIICKVRDAGLLPDKHAIGVDPAGIGAVVDELISPERGFTLDHITAVQQGWKLNGAIKTAERGIGAAAIKNGWKPNSASAEAEMKKPGMEIVHAGQPLMAWCVGNAKVVQVGNAISITKQVSGAAKIDPLMAGFSAISLMALNPEAAVIRQGFVELG
jgi:phage terminase large subunit-like protein